MLYVSREEHERTIRWAKNEIQALKNRLGWAAETDLVGGDYEGDLGDPAADGYALVSTAAGVRSWVDLSAIYSSLGHNHSGVYEPVFEAATPDPTLKYYRGDKSWQTLNQAAVVGLTTADSPAFAGLTTSGNMTAKGFLIRDYATYCATSIYVYSATTSHYPLLALYRSHRDTWGLTTTVTGEEIGRIRFNGVNAAATPAYANGAYIRVVQNGTAGSSYVPVDMQFYISGGASVINALTLTQSGGVHVGGTTGVEDNAILVDGKFGCNGKAVQAAYASGGALAAYASGTYGLDSAANMSALHALVVAIRAALVANGIMS